MNLYIHINADNKDYKQFFDLQNKSDAPVAKAITKDTIIKWLSKRTTKSDILSQGYKLKKVNDIYYIENTDIKLLLINQDLHKIGNAHLNFNVSDDAYTNTDEYYLYAVSAPAEILLKNDVNKKVGCTIKDYVVYSPFSDVRTPPDDVIILPSYDEYTENTILKNETTVFVSSKAVLGEYYWKILCELIIDDTSEIEIVDENNDYFIAWKKVTFPYSDGTSDKYSSGKYILYSIDKKSLKATEIKEQEYLTDPDNTILREFLGEYADDSYLLRF